MEKLQIQKFGITKDGSKPYLYKMKNDAGMEVQVSDFGGDPCECDRFGSR